MQQQAYKKYSSKPTIRLDFSKKTKNVLIILNLNIKLHNS